MFPTALLAILGAILAPLCLVEAEGTTTTSFTLEARAAPQVINGDFSQPLKPGWYWNQLGARVTRQPLPGQPSNYALNFGNVNCENEQYISVFGHMINLVPGGKYKLSFKFMYTKPTNHIRFSGSAFPTHGCVSRVNLHMLQSVPCDHILDPCPVTLFHNQRYNRAVDKLKLYTYTGLFTAPNASNLTVEIDPNTCGYSGTTYLDEFIVTSIS